jgi:hypothetical protein
MRLSARDGRAVLSAAEEAESAPRPSAPWPSAPPGWPAAGFASGAPIAVREVDPHSLALGADLADALHEWARVADAIGRSAGAVDAIAGDLVSRRGLQLAARVAAAMGASVSYVDPLSGETREVAVPEADQSQYRVPAAPWLRERDDLPAVDGTGVLMADHPADYDPDEPTPWAAGVTVTAFVAVMITVVVVTLSVGLGESNHWLPLIANVVIAIGLAPSVWLTRKVRVWRWVAYGIVGGLLVGWVGLLLTLL